MTPEHGRNIGRGGKGTIAHLAVSVVTPAMRRSARVEGTAVDISAVNGRQGERPVHQLWCVGEIRAIPNGAFATFTPTIDVIGRRAAARVFAAGVNGDKRETSRHERGVQLSAHRPIAQPPPESISPTVPLVRCGHGARMIFAGGDRPEREAPRDHDREILVVAAGSVAEVARPILSPAVGSPGAGQGAGVEA